MNNILDEVQLTIEKSRDIWIKHRNKIATKYGSISTTSKISVLVNKECDAIYYVYKEELQKRTTPILKELRNEAESVIQMAKSVSDESVADISLEIKEIEIQIGSLKHTRNELISQLATKKQISRDDYLNAHTGRLIQLSELLISTATDYIAESEYQLCADIESRINEVIKKYPDKIQSVRHVHKNLLK
jgi:uncharacterized radical SAM superfamily Fe-S cluster-containing enzyme